MSDMERYLELREKIIRPAMEKLKAEYEAQGYICSIGAIKRKDETSESHQGTKVIRSTCEGISLSRTQVSTNNKQTVSVSLSDGGSVLLGNVAVMGYRHFKLDEVTSELIEKAIGEAFFN